jgi:hypothetical protein
MLTADAPSPALPGAAVSAGPEAGSTLPPVLWAEAVEAGIVSAPAPNSARPHKSQVERRVVEAKEEVVLWAKRGDMQASMEAHPSRGVAAW